MGSRGARSPRGACSLKLTDLKPRWYSTPGVPGSQGFTFECPHCRTLPRGSRMVRLAVAFANAIGGPAVELSPSKINAAIYGPVGSDKPGDPVILPGVLWTRVGETFESLSLSPSVNCSGSGHWHGTISLGQCSG
jgi:hypothetical protein